MDVLGDLLDRSRARGATFGRITLAPPWGVTFETSLPLAVHAVLGGEAWISAGGSSQRLLAGDLALVRGPGASQLAAGQQPRLVVLEEAVARFGAGGNEIVFPGERTAELVCGAYSFSGDLCAAVLDTLPPVVCLRAGADSVALRPLLMLLGDELQHQRPGQQVVLDRFLDLILVQSLRAHYARPESRPPRWYLALDDGPVGAALRAMHDQPAKTWSVAELAAIAGLSRAAFARRFAELVGDPPLTYLTGWRIKLARELLREPGATLAQVASEVGYANEYAFSAAFKRHTGDPPGRWRTRQSAQLGKPLT
jgi:AraC-like DNA-binding protein